MTNIKIRQNLKFKTATIGCFLRFSLSKKNLALANLLATMQTNASENYPGVSVQAKALAEKYDMRLGVFPEVFGNQIILFYNLSFIEPREILNPDYNYGEIVDTFFKIIKYPLFNPQLLYLAKEELKSERAQYLDIPANYALNQFYKYWYRNEVKYTDNIFGDPNILKNCTNEQIKAFYQQLKSTPAIFLGLVENPDLMTDLVQEKIDWPGFSTPFVTNNLAIPAHFSPIDKIEDGKNGQTQLLMGFGYDYELPLNFRQFGGLILSQYLAGDESSKLFTNVREKLGAAYAIDAVNLLDNSLFLISTGIDFKKLEQTKAEITKSILDIANGKIDEKLFIKAKKALKRMYLSNEDLQSLRLVQMLVNSLRDRDITIEERIQKVSNFTSKKLIEFSKSLFLNESYCLK